ncbi:MAG: hypothetical protein N3D10_03780 [Candidatus Micrarchaeota archaeon]|nr:hypothetical protein [Candidatus Micrarchaeota archaeon]
MFDQKTFQKIKNEIMIYGYKKIKTALGTLLLFESIENLDILKVKKALQLEARLDVTKHGLGPIQTLSSVYFKNIYSLPTAALVSPIFKNFNTKNFYIIRKELKEQIEAILKEAGAKI